MRHEGCLALHVKSTFQVIDSSSGRLMSSVNEFIFAACISPLRPILLNSVRTIFRGLQTFNCQANLTSHEDDISPLFALCRRHARWQSARLHEHSRRLSKRSSRPTSLWKRKRAKPVIPATFCCTGDSWGP